VAKASVFSVKIMRKEGRERGNKIQRRKRRSPFSTLKSFPRSLSLFLRTTKFSRPSRNFHVRIAAEMPWWFY
jgi:hypothetical protein